MYIQFRRLAILAVAVLCFVSAHATTYYLSPTGNDSNNGLSANYPWASPNHSLNCGDVILAAAGQYNNANFYTGKWGAVNCPAGNNVAWLKCATFDTCKINAANNQGMWVDANYWGVQGWEVTANPNNTYGTCFMAAPRWTDKKTVHHIIFANNVANGCSQGGFESTNFGTAAVDYFNVLGNVAYNASSGSATCSSGISVYQPQMSDTAAGTHIYIAGNFSYGNLDPKQCNGTSPTDGEGIILDTFDGSQGGVPSYTAQAVAYNNMTIGNGGVGIEVYNNQTGTNHANILINQNTIWGNHTDPNQSWYGCGEISVSSAKNVHTNGNLVSTQSATGCNGHPIYALSTSAGDTSDSFDNNVAYGYSGNNTFTYASGSFKYNSDNQLGTSPAFRGAWLPGAPSCSGQTNVPYCMSGLVYNFQATASGASTKGYQWPLGSSVADPLFPKWLCTANVPSGLITMGCS